MLLIKTICLEDIVSVDCKQRNSEYEIMETKRYGKTVKEKTN